MRLAFELFAGFVAIALVLFVAGMGFSALPDSLRRLQSARTPRGLVLASVLVVLFFLGYILSRG